MLKLSQISHSCVVLCCVLKEVSDQSHDVIQENQRVQRLSQICASNLCVRRAIAVVLCCSVVLLFLIPCVLQFVD